MSAFFVEENQTPAAKAALIPGLVGTTEVTIIYLTKVQPKHKVSVVVLFTYVSSVCQQTRMHELPAEDRALWPLVTCALAPVQAETFDYPEVR